ncbi:PfkB family carbohydrate kinase [Acuticoccus sediminis]|uniref:PfkB family carbohydrate kinase n=1 Tax=Acuticoccus sediminis TaxID=2184697 RepID=UPI0013911B9B|nr:PfkB family carbohydrate kinase [Acuticoccus sediminis]
MIVSCGEALVDLMPERQDGGLVYRPVLGGSAYNVALGIARLGGASSYLWELSTDELGCAFAAALEEEGVDIASVRRSARATPVGIVDLSGPEPRYNIADPDRVMHDTVPPPLPERASIVVVGSAVLAQEPVATALEALAASAPLVAMDYNVRQPSISDLKTYRARLERMSSRAGIVKASEADLHMIGVDVPEAFLHRMLEAGAAMVVLTKGADGVSATTSAGTVSVAARRVDVVDAVGAGDAFMAGLLAALQFEGLLSGPALRQLTAPRLTDALDAAQSVAAAACTKRGAVMPKCSEIGGRFRRLA